MNDFYRLVYDVVVRVPAGRVTTYGAIARYLGDPRKAREVGWALHAKPDSSPAPAHRVVNREGRLSGGWAFGGPSVQRSLLEAEGVTFLAGGLVDLGKHLWEPGVGGGEWGAEGGERVAWNGARAAGAYEEDQGPPDP